MIPIDVQNVGDAALKKSLPLDVTMDGEIVEIKEDYAVASVADIFSEEGIVARKHWWREVLRGGDYEGKVDTGEVDDNRTVSELIERLNNDKEEIVWIWAAQNKHDVSGYYWLMSQLKDFQGRVFIL